MNSEQFYLNRVEPPAGICPCCHQPTPTGNSNKCMFCLLDEYQAEIREKYSGGFDE